MQEKNVVTIDYLGDPERFADFLNALWFSGNRILTSVNIRECKADSFQDLERNPIRSTPARYSGI